MADNRVAYPPFMRGCQVSNPVGKRIDHKDESLHAYIREPARLGWDDGG